MSLAPMYLTQFRLNTARAGARKLLSSPQAMHAAVMSSFSEPPATEGEASSPRVLWRLDRNARSEVRLFLSSPARPDLTHLVEQAGWPAVATPGAPGWKTYDYGTFLARLDKGSTWDFRLTANPVHYARTKKGQKSTKRTAHLVPEYQLQWLLDRQDRGGFRVLEKPPERRHVQHGDEYQCVVREQRNLSFRKRGNDDRVQLLAVTYDGRLEVTDPDALRALLTRGLGKAKAYGCGLMTLAPTPQGS